MKNINNFSAKNEELSSIEKELKKKKEEISGLKTKMDVEIEKINKQYLSIAIEDSLKVLPSVAKGSKVFIEKLNKQSDLYDHNHFNKIIRFVTFIEDSESKYNKSYKSLVKDYVSKPKKEDAEDLVKQHQLLHSEYKLLNALCTCVKSDKVMYNKVYNGLEDRGIFLTDYEKLTMEYLASIASDISQVVGYLANINDSLLEINDGIGGINSSLWSIDSNLNDMSFSLQEIDGGIKAGNILKSVQTYQLYKINKNTKSIN
jgi:hypothetical protein